MNKAILTILLFCFAVFSAGAQVENKKSTTTSSKNAVEQSKVKNERANNVRATEANQDNLQPENVNAPVIVFDKTVHDYGTLDQTDDGKCEFRFTNEGKEPLILSNVKAS